MDALRSTETLLVIAIVIGFTLGFLVLRALTKSISAAAIIGTPAALILVLGMLTLTAMIGGLITRDESAWAVAATGMGAIAASLTSWFGKHAEDDPTSRSVEPQEDPTKKENNNE